MMVSQTIMRSLEQLRENLTRAMIGQFVWALTYWTFWLVCNFMCNRSTLRVNVWDYA